VALTIILLAYVQFVQSTVSVALARRAAFFGVGAEAEVAIFAFLALASMDKVLAWAYDAASDSQVFVAAGEVGFGAVRVACARLADRVVV
jgi:hypothetical protein